MQNPQSEHGDVLGLRLPSLAVLAQLEADLVTFSERAASLQCRHVNEHVRSNISGSNEAKSLWEGTME